MHDIVGKFLAFGLGALLLFYLPFLVIALKQDNLKQSYIDNAAADFVDSARFNGVITQQSYKSLVHAVDSMQPNCDIQIYVSEKAVIPSSSDPKKYITTTVSLNEIDILSALFPDGTQSTDPFVLHKGDKIRLTIKNTTPTLGEQMLKFIIDRKLPYRIYTNVSGYVGNTKQY